MSNEHYDVAFTDALDMGADSQHALGPDEILMMRETNHSEDEGTRAKAACLMSVVMAVTWQTNCTRTIRDRVAVVASMFCCDILPKESIWKGREEWEQAREALARCPAIEWDADAGPVILALMTQKGWTVRAVGLHALCFLYHYQADSSLRPRIAQSFEAIGRAIGLTAENMRSAISAAMQRGPLELERKMRRTTKAKAANTAWYMKKPECRAALRLAMTGKQNRLGSQASDREIMEMREGVPVKPQFAGKTSLQLRQMFDEMERKQQDKYTR